MRDHGLMRIVHTHHVDLQKALEYVGLDLQKGRLFAKDPAQHTRMSSRPNAVSV